jgi:uncharacterized protein (DUF58 family)
MGDDIRTIDWNVTSRTGSLHVKKFTEERELTVLLMLDASGSSDFGTRARFKREVAAEMGALLAFSAIKNNDRVGLVLGTEVIEQMLPPKKGEKHVLRVIREILAHGSAAPQASTHRGRMWPWRRSPRPRGVREGTDIAGAMNFLMRSAKRKAVCFVVSDFFDSDYLTAMRTANRKHDVIAVRVVDPRERVIPNVGLVTLRDPETGRQALFDTSSPSFRRSFEQLAEQHALTLQQQFRSSSIDFITIDPSASVVDPLVRFFHTRERRMRR